MNCKASSAKWRTLNWKWVCANRRTGRVLRFVDEPCFDVCPRCFDGTVKVEVHMGRRVEADPKLPEQPSPAEVEILAAIVASPGIEFEELRGKISRRATSTATLRLKKRGLVVSRPSLRDARRSRWWPKEEL